MLLKRSRAEQSRADETRRTSRAEPTRRDETNEVVKPLVFLRTNTLLQSHYQYYMVLSKHLGKSQLFFSMPHNSEEIICILMICLFDWRPSSPLSLPSLDLRRAKLILPPPPKSLELPQVPFGLSRMPSISQATGLRSPMQQMSNGRGKQVMRNVRKR